MKTVAILAGEGYEDLELWHPRFRLLEMVAGVLVASGDGRERRSKHGYPTDAQMRTSELQAADLDPVALRWI